MMPDVDTMMPDVDCTTEQLSGINKQDYCQISHFTINRLYACLLYTSDAADER